MTIRTQVDTLILPTASWTPIFTFATLGNLSVSYTTQKGLFTRIGNLVFVNFFLTFTPTFTTASGAASISGLPIQSASTTDNYAGSVLLTASGIPFPTGTTQASITVIPGSTSIALNAQGTGVGTTNFSTTQFLSGGGQTIVGSISYLV